MVASTTLLGVVAAFAAQISLRRVYAARAGISPAQARIASHSTVCLAHNVAVTLVTARLTPLRALLIEGDAQWHTQIYGFGLTASLSAAFFIYDLLSISNWVVYSPLMVAHHAVASCCWLASAHIGFAQPWIAYCMLTEVSSIFLSARTLLIALGAKTGRLYPVVSILFLLSFLLIRTLPIVPLARTWLQKPPIGAATCGPARAAQLMGWLSAVPLLLNAFWSVAILKKAKAELSGRAALGGAGVVAAANEATAKVKQ